MNHEITQEQAQIAAQWWADQIAAPKFDNGDDSNAGGMAMALAMMAHNPVESDSVEEFKNELEALIIDRQPRGIHVDYGPDAILSDAAKMAGMVDGGIVQFPWKTNMWLRDGGIEVSCGYGSPNKTLLEATTSDLPPSTEA